MLDKLKFWKALLKKKHKKPNDSVKKKIIKHLRIQHWRGSRKNFLQNYFPQRKFKNFVTPHLGFAKLTYLDFFFKAKNYAQAYAFQGRVSYLPQINPLEHRFFFSIVNHWLVLRELFLIYELFFLFKTTSIYNDFLLSPYYLNFFASALLYEKLSYFLIIPQVWKKFLNFSECLLKIKLTTSNFFFTALDALTYKTLLTGTGGMLHVPLLRQSNILSNKAKLSKKKFALRQDIKHKRSSENRSFQTNQPRSKKFLRRQSSTSLNKKKRPKWIEKTSFTSLFYLCDKFFNALKDFGYLHIRFWLLGHKVYNVFFKQKIISRWKMQYSNMLFLSPYIIFQANRCHNGMRLKKARRV